MAILRVLAVAAMMTVSLLAGAQARSLDDILSTGELRIGVNPNYPPTAMYDDKNQLVGFDIDVATKLASMLGVKPNFVTVDPNSRVPFITSGRIDIVLGGMTRTPDRAKLIDFTLPIMTESLGALSIEGKPFKNLSDLDKDTVTLAEVRGTTPIPWIAANLPHAKVLLLDNHPDVLRAVAQGRADAVVDDLASLGEVSKKIDAHWMPLAGHAKEVDWDCIGVNRADQSLRRWLNVAIFSLEQSEFIQQAYKKWYGFDMSAPIPLSPYF
ncbi:MAG: transporter substrate-binding domain-containing protein [Proteobacteria bacterium]|nr:transporter substrate-binding domain-containing protein [Pseudomonadota bacterium]